jgi:hypothetical protein
VRVAVGQLFAVASLQRELARTSMRSLGRLVALDPAGSSQKRHLQRAVGALIVAGSELAWRPTRRASLGHTMRPAVRRELIIGLRELHAAIPTGRRGRTVVGTVISTTVGTTFAARARAARLR